MASSGPLNIHFHNVEAPCSSRLVTEPWCAGCVGGHTHTHTHTSCCTQTQAWRSPHLIILVLTWEKGPSVFASALFEFARVFFGDSLCENHSKGQSRARRNAQGSYSGQRVLVGVVDCYSVVERTSQGFGARGAGPGFWHPSLLPV